MKNWIIKNIWITIGIVLIVGFLAGKILSPSNSNSTEKEHVHENENSTIWTCAMHPQIRMDKPGNCPICGMELIPLETEKSKIDIDAVEMTEDAMKLSNIQTMVVGYQNPTKEVRLNGKIQVDERRIYSQSSHIAGRIEQLDISFVGEAIKKGQRIATIYSPDLVTAQKELLMANKVKNEQPSLFAAAKEKLKSWKLTDKQINKIITEGKTIDRFPILADVSGIVLQKKVNLGDYVERGMSILEIADLSNVWVLFDVYEGDLNWVKVGDKVEYTIASFPGEKFTGTITFVDPTINQKTRVAKARVDVTNSGNKLKPEMFVSGVIKNQMTQVNSKSIVVPKSAVMWTGERSIVYVRNNSNDKVHFTLREVVLGTSTGNGFIINSGLEQGEEIVVNGTFTVDAAAQLAGKPSMMNQKGGKSAIVDHSKMKMK